MTPEELGRLSEERKALGIPAKYDAPNETVSAILSKQDEIINKLNAILAAVEASSDGDTLQTALAAVDLVAVQKIQLSL